MSFKSVFLSLFGDQIKKEFFPDSIILEKLLNLKLKEIEITKVDCFYAQNLWNFIQHKSNNKKTDDIVNLFDSLIEYGPKEKSQFDLRKLTNVSASKSKSWGYSFDTMYSFGKHLIQDVDIETLEGNSYSSIEKCLHHISNDADYIFNIDYVAWEKRYDWNNSGGSHHCAVAVFYAKNLRKEYLVNATLRTLRINVDVVKRLNDQYHIFAVNSDKVYNLKDCFEKNQCIHLKTTNCANSLLIFEKNNEVNQKVLRFFEIYDQRYILNLNSFISNLLEKQGNLENMEVL